MRRRARTTFYAGNRVYAEGQLVAADDPAVAGREHLFEPVDQPADPKPRKRPVKKAAGR